jgi:hypothetical protein
MKYFIITLSTAVLFVINLQAQTDVLSGVWVLNEGVQDWNTGEMVESASVGVLDMETGLFELVHEFEGASFTTNILIEDGSAFIGADNKIVKINVETLEVEASVEAEGVRQLAYYDGLIYMTRGDVDAVTWASVEFDSYLLWFDAETLEQVGELPASEGVGFSSEGISVVDGVVYVAVNNGFAWAQEVGILGVYDVNTGAYEEYDLGEDGKNPAHIKVFDGVVLMVNNTDWSATSLSRVELVSLGAEEASVNTVYVDGVAAGCHAAAVMGDELVFQVSGELGMRKASVTDLSPAATMWGPATYEYYRMAVNPLNGDVYGTVTDFSGTVHEVHVLNSDGDFISSFETGSVPGGIAFDIRSVDSVNDMVTDGQSVVVGAYDVMGRVWSQGNRGIKIERLENGTITKSWVVQ